MNSLALPTFVSGKLYLVSAPRSTGRALINEFIAHLALVSPVTVLDGGGSSIDPLYIARLLRRQVPAYLPLLERVQIARAFTCHELVTLLESEASGQAPVVILDFLSLLDDENLSTIERQTVFLRLVRRLVVLDQNQPVLLWARPPVLPHTQELARQLVKLADEVFSFQAPTQLEQARLF